ncbi:MAG TPA: PEP-CTERM sorting domain-containing protein [Terriglobia bacterium]
MLKWIHTPVAALRSSRVLLFSLLAIAASSLPGMPAYGDALTLGNLLGNYSIVSAGPNASIMVNSGPITGSILLGDGTNTMSSGGGGGRVTGTVYLSGTVKGDDLWHIATAPMTQLIAASFGQQAFMDANTLSATAAGLTATQAYANINGTQTINGTGGLNVIDVGSLHNPNLTISGTASSIFVFNVSGSFQTNEALTLDGVTASQILWNFTGNSGNVFQTSGGDLLYGTFLATNGGNFQFSNLDLSGELINTGGRIQFVSGSEIASNQPFAGTGVPEPSTMTLLAAGLTVGLFVRRHSGSTRQSQKS